jgi:hydrogenase nickel incorporation protein HypA/HybF
VGDGAGVVIDSLEFCFNSITAGTPLQETTLKIERVPFVVRCNACGKSAVNENGFFLCTFCEGSDVALISGNELEVSAMELADEKEILV